MLSSWRYGPQHGPLRSPARWRIYPLPARVPLASCRAARALVVKLLRTVSAHVRLRVSRAIRRAHRKPGRRRRAAQACAIEQTKTPRNHARGPLATPMEPQPHFARLGRCLASPAALLLLVADARAGLPQGGRTTGGGSKPGWQESQAKRQATRQRRKNTHTRCNRAANSSLLFFFCQHFCFFLSLCRL